jgi:hypothetical protein
LHHIFILIQINFRRHQSFVPNRSGIKVDAISLRFRVDGLHDQRVCARRPAGAQLIPEFRRSGRRPTAAAELFQRQRYAIASRQSHLDRLAIGLFRAGVEAWPEQIARILIKDDPSPLEIRRDEQRADARALEQPSKAGK